MINYYVYRLLQLVMATSNIIQIYITLQLLDMELSYSALVFALFASLQIMLFNSLQQCIAQVLNLVHLKRHVTTGYLSKY
jgi:hypothetical protein